MCVLLIPSLPLLPFNQSQRPDSSRHDASVLVVRQVAVGTLYLQYDAREDVIHGLEGAGCKLQVLRSMNNDNGVDITSVYR